MAIETKGMAVTEKRKIAVLGGGPSALAAVFWLTSTEELRERYDITVYQMGWRLGGKGASGRGEDGRILEHGLHILFGFYQNFFFMIRQAYAELHRPKEHPLQTWRQAFHPGGIGVEEEYVLGAWDPWIIAFPRNRDVPGSGGALPRVSQYFAMMFQGFFAMLFGWRKGFSRTQRLYPNGMAWENTPDPPLGGPEPWTTVMLFRLAMWTLTALTWMIWVLNRYAPWILTALGAVRQSIWWFLLRLARSNRRSHRLWLDLDAIFAILRGTITDRLLLKGGFNKIDDLDFRVWLLRHGLHKETLGTTLVRTIYDAAFSYENGDPDRQRVSAGSAVKVLLRWAITYKGAAYFRMMAGMGDTVFTPLYQVLKSRGVKFQFFHKVETLHLSQDRKRIARITLNRQVELNDKQKEYDPLQTIRGLECWPAKPLYDQITNADQIREINLESYYNGYRGTEVCLEAGKDFDEILFGIPVGAVRYICGELVDNPDTPQWRDMIDNVKSVQTVAAQLWMKPRLNSLGWDTPQPLLSLFVEPFNTWADMSHLVPREDWPKGVTVGNISYFTGAQIGPTDPPPPSDTEFQVRMDNEAHKDFVDFLEGRSKNPARDPGTGGITTIWPDAAAPSDPERLDWSLLVDPKEHTGIARLSTQYLRSNCDPAERCTLSLPGTNKYRIKADETGYDNLFVTGDWIDNNLYLAFMEASFQSGILSARAVSGISFPIIGEWLNG